MVVSTFYPFIGKSFPYISCLSLHGLHEESIIFWDKLVCCRCPTQIAFILSASSLCWITWKHLASWIWIFCPYWPVLHETILWWRCILLLFLHWLLNKCNRCTRRKTDSTVGEAMYRLWSNTLPSISILHSVYWNSHFLYFKQNNMDKSYILQYQ